VPRRDLTFSGRARQAWTIATIELRRVFFAKRSLWVFALALFPSLAFFGHGVETKIRSERLARRGLTAPAAGVAPRRVCRSAPPGAPAEQGQAADDHGTGAQGGHQRGIATGSGQVTLGGPADAAHLR